MSDEATLWLGRAGDDTPVLLPVETLLRHVMALGSSGSGKTVFCKVLLEEALRLGLPAIVIDPQGDLCSLGAGTLDDEELRERGVDPGVAQALREKAEVVVFTPGSSCGIPLCADPVDPALFDLPLAERTRSVTRTAAVVVGLLGFDLDSDDGAGLAAVLDRALHEMVEAGTRPSLARLTEHLAAAAQEDFATYARYLDSRKLRLALQRLARLDVGARRLLFHDGVPIDIDVLLGRDPRAPVAPGRVRVAVIYLNTLHQQEDKDFFVAALVDRLYSWMLAHPSAEPQALFYIDEVAPFIPPVRKPACKDGLSLLFKQARKYGLCCVMATQNPGDVDYRAMAQFGTWALGRLSTRQDLKKVEPTVKSLAPDDTDAILGRLPSLKPGEVVLLSPDRFDRPVELKTRWLATKHETWGETRIESYSEPLRARFDGLTSAARAGEPAHRADAAAPSAIPKAIPNARPASTVDPASEGALGLDEPPAEDLDEADRDEAERGDVGGEEARHDEPPELEALADGNVEAAPIGRDAPLLAALVSVASAAVKDLASRLDCSEGATRRGLERLVARGDVRVYSEGRARRYWAVETGGRPDLPSMPGKVRCLVAHVGPAAASKIAATHARSRTLGILGDDERFERAELSHRLIYKLDFEERVSRSLLGRLFGTSHDERLGSVYLHPHNLGVLVFTNDVGIRFEDVPSGSASDIRDFDGVTEVEDRAPGRLALDDADWRKRKSVETVRASFERRFSATPGEVSPLFVPLWTLLFRGENGSLRRIVIDGLVGKPARWLPPAE